MTPCHAQKYQEALEGMRQYASRMFPGPMPAWGQAAMQQHAHYYAAQACGEKPMAYGTFNDYAALGITRRGADDGTVRTISMAGYGAYTCQACNRIPGVKDGYNCPVCSGGANQRTERRMGGFAGAATDTSKIPGGGQCDKAAFRARGKEGQLAYCDCMFPAGAARDACKATANGRIFGLGALDPMTCKGKIDMLVVSGGVANPFEDFNEGMYCANAVGGDTLRAAEGILKSLFPKTSGGTGTGGGGGTDTGGPGDTGGGGGGGGGGEAPKMNTALLVGGAAVLVAAIFLLKK